MHLMRVQAHYSTFHIIAIINIVFTSDIVALFVFIVGVIWDRLIG